jgi:hypothetical protein
MNADFGASVFGRYPPDPPEFTDRRVDLVGRMLPVASDVDAVEAAPPEMAVVADHVGAASVTPTRRTRAGVVRTLPHKATIQARIEKGTGRDTRGQFEFARCLLQIEVMQRATDSLLSPAERASQDRRQEKAHEREERVLVNSGCRPGSRWHRPAPRRSAAPALGRR